MSTSASGPSSSSANPQRIQATLQQQQHQSGSLYSFSVHQPYTNWPLHASPAAPYAPSWYALPTQSYGPPKTYRENATQTQNSHEDAGTGNGAEGKEKEEAEDPSSQYRRHWDAALSTFLKRAGLYQALSGFREDILLLNSDWEHKQIPAALQALVKDISDIKHEEGSDLLPEKPLDERKLDYVHAQKGTVAQSPSTTTKSVARLLRQARKRNDASNRAEFLHTAAEKRRRLNELGETPSTSHSVPLADGGKGNGEGSTSDERIGSSSRTKDKAGANAGDVTINKTMNNAYTAAATASIPSCARLDAKPQNRDVQMKYDIAKNEDGPLKRTMRRSGHIQGENCSGTEGQAGRRVGNAFGVEAESSTRGVTLERHPGLAERFGSVEAHLAVRYVPSPPRSLLDRIKCLEDHIIKLEKDYPPWAALHFSQPSRGWPPPPRLTPIIVASHLASTGHTAESVSNTNDTYAHHYASPPANASRGQSTNSKAAGVAKAKPAQSSLHRAVMEKLEIQRALGDLATGAGPTERGV